jgi:hypothetical protein
MIKVFFRFGILCMVLVSASFFLCLPEAVQAQERSSTGTLAGFIYGADQRAVVPDAIVKIRRIEDGKEYQSSPTDEYGFFRMEGIEEGRYVLGVVSREEDFNFDYSILIKADEAAFLSLGLNRGVEPVSDEAAEEVEMGIKEGSFFAHPEGRAIFDDSVSENLIGVYTALRPPPISISFWRWIWNWWRWWWSHRWSGPRRR